MTLIVPDSMKVRAELGALEPAKKKAVRAKRHPWIGSPRMLILSSRSWEGDEVVRGLAALFGECKWDGGRWRTKKTQLRLPGF